MEMKVGSYNIRSSFSGGTPMVKSAPKVRKLDIAGIQNRDGFSGLKLADGQMEQLMYFKNNVGNVSLLSKSVVRLDDYPARAVESARTLNYYMDTFNTQFGEKLREKGVPENIEFEFDFDVNSGTPTVTGISDETYREDVQKALEELSWNPVLTGIADGSRILNGYQTSVYYNKVSVSLEKRFGQDISELFLNEDGSIGGANAFLSAVLKEEKKSPDFDASKEYRFVTKSLYSVLARITADEDASENISHLAYSGGKISGNDGEVKLGITDLDTVDGKIVAQAGHRQLMDIWAENK